MLRPNPNIVGMDSYQPENSRAKKTPFPRLFITCSFLSFDWKDFWQMIWKWIINLMLGHRVQLHSNFLHGSHKEVYTSCCIFAALVCPMDTLLPMCDTPYNSASTWTGNSDKFLKRKAITGFFGEKAACLPVISPLTRALEFKGIYKTLLRPLCQIFT